MTGRSTLFAACIAALPLIACRTPTSPTKALPFIEGRYTLNVLATTSALVDVIRACPTATPTASPVATVMLTPEGSRWRARPQTLADGSFEMVFDPAEPGVALQSVDATGTIRGTLNEGRSFASASSVRFGDGASTVAFSGRSLFNGESASGTFDGPATISGTGITSYTCGASTLNWTLVKSSQ